MTPLLAQRVRADRGFERLYRRHAGDVFRYALAVLHNQADAEDVTQTTFMNAYRAIERGEKPHNAHNWLIAIAHNVCRQRFRQSLRRPSEVAWNEDIAEPLVEDDTAPTTEDIRRALSHLAFNQRAALVMRELEGRSYAEIGQVLDLSTSAVETLIFRARRALREQLEGALTCGEAELAISKQLDGRLSRAEKGQLRAHLRECPECAMFARRQRAQRRALRSLGAIPLPTSLLSLFGGGGTAAGVAVAGKAAAVVAATALAGGAGYESYHHLVDTGGASKPRPAPAVVRHSPERPAVEPAADRSRAVVVPSDARRTVPAEGPRGRGRAVGAGGTAIGLAVAGAATDGRKIGNGKRGQRHPSAPPGPVHKGDHVAPGLVRTKHGHAKRTPPPRRARPAKPKTTKRPAAPAQGGQQPPGAQDGAAHGKKADPAPLPDAQALTVPAVTVPTLPSPLDPVDDEAGTKSGKSLRKFLAGPASP